MGEQEHSSISATSSLCSGIMRSLRGKMFVYVALVSTFCIIMFIFSRTHSNLKELEGVNQKCQQQRDSLSAQLQVVYEHKNRLEKSLQQEKSDHTHTREECDSQHQEMEKKQLQDKDKIELLEKHQTELKNSVSQLDEEKKIYEKKMQDQLQSQQNQKDEEIKRIQTQLKELLLEKEKLKQFKDDIEMKLQQQMGDLNLCQMQREQMELKLNAAQDQMKWIQGHRQFAESPNSDKKAEENRNQRPSPKTNEKAAENFGNEIVGLANASNDKDKARQVLMKPNIHPPDVKKPTPDLKKQKKTLENIPDNVDNHGQLANDVDNHGQLANADTKDKMVGNVAEIDSSKRNIALQEQGGGKPETNDIGVVPENGGRIFEQEPQNHPQMQPPQHFDGAGEQGELGIYRQNAMEEQKHQLEQPFKKDIHYPIEMRNNMINYLHHGLAAPHLQGFNDGQRQDKYVHDTHEDQLNQMPPIVNLVKKDLNRNHRMLDPGPGERKQYEEDEDDDQEGENDEEQMMNGGQPVRGKQFPDTDFDDQENNDNGAKEEEGVVVAPK